MPDRKLASRRIPSPPSSSDQSGSVASPVGLAVGEHPSLAVASAHVVGAELDLRALHSQAPPLTRRPLPDKGLLADEPVAGTPVEQELVIVERTEARVCRDGALYPQDNP